MSHAWLDIPHATDSLTDFQSHGQVGGNNLSIYHTVLPMVTHARVSQTTILPLLKPSFLGKLKNNRCSAWRKACYILGRSLDKPITCTMVCEKNWPETAKSRSMREGEEFYAQQWNPDSRTWWWCLSFNSMQPQNSLLSYCTHDWLGFHFGWE